MAIGLLSKRNKEINKVFLLPIMDIHKNPKQPRTFFDEQGIRELAASIEENGLLQPVTVRKIRDGYYELIAGERRTLAYKHLGYNTVPAIIEEISDSQSAVLALIENVQRQNLNYFEEALAITRLMNELGLTQNQISEKLGKAQSTIANKLRLLKFSFDIQKIIIDKQLTERHARALLKLTDEQYLSTAINYIVEKNLNVEQTELYIQQINETANNKKVSKRLFVIKDIRIFFNTINRAVSMLNGAGISAVTQKQEFDDFIEMKILIPKNKM